MPGGIIFDDVVDVYYDDLPVASAHLNLVN